MHAVPTPLSPAEAHVVVVGAGGIGCPAGWALAEAGIGRLTILDGDVVEPSNLPRQVLYGSADVGRPKAEVAAERLRGHGSDVVGRAERLDDTTSDSVLTGADLLIDATDGARAKDWVNALAVRKGVPLVHAAGLRSEGRILDVPAAGRPCLACLFGRLEEEQGSCADLGVWGGVVGAVGFLAAAQAIARLADPTAPSRGYAVLDLDGGRGVTLGAEASPVCPVCAGETRGEPEAYPDDAAACAPAGAEGDAGTALLDLLDEACPMNLLRARQALEALASGETLDVRLGAEGRESVPEGLRALGHRVEVLGSNEAALLLRVARGGDPAGGAPVSRLARDDLLRFARQVVLPDVGEPGQQRLIAADVEVQGRGAAAETAAVYLRAAGVGSVRLAEETRGAVAVRIGPGGKDMAIAFSVAPCTGGARIVTGSGARDPDPDPDLAAGPLARALGALLADTVCRAIVLDRQDAPRVVVRADGTIGTD